MRTPCLASGRIERATDSGFARERGGMTVALIAVAATGCALRNELSGPGPRHGRPVRSCGPQQEFTPAHRPQQSEVERVIRTLKEQCIHRHRHEGPQHASHMADDWIRLYHHRAGAGHEDTRQRIRFSVLPCAGTTGSLQLRADAVIRLSNGRISTDEHLDGAVDALRVRNAIAR